MKFNQITPDENSGVYKNFIHRTLIVLGAYKDFIHRTLIVLGVYQKFNQNAD